MAKLVFTNIRYFMGSADLTGQSNKVEIDDMFEEKDVTTFNSSGAKELIGGIETVTLSSEGVIDRAEMIAADQYFWNQRRVVEANSACPDGATVGSVAYMTQAIRLGSKLFGTVGDVEGWTAASAGSYPLARGTVLSNPGTAITAASGNGTGVQLGAVGATQRLFGAIHVLSVAGTLSPTLAVTIQSDSANTFAATPETRLTFSTFTAAGSEVQRSAVGAHADTWYRMQYVVTDNGGVGESFLALVVVAIA